MTRRGREGVKGGARGGASKRFGKETPRSGARKENVYDDLDVLAVKSLKHVNNTKDQECSGSTKRDYSKVSIHLITVNHLEGEHSPVLTEILVANIFPPKTAIPVQIE